MQDVYGKQCPSKTTVVEWCRKFSNGRQSTADLDLPRSGAPRHAKSDDTNVAAVRTAVVENRRVRVRELADRFDISVGTIHAVIHVNINAFRYSESLTRLRTAIKNKRSGLLTEGVILLLDNAGPHIANIITSQFAQMGWEVFEHPPYSLDLSPCL